MNAAEASDWLIVVDALATATDGQIADDERRRAAEAAARLSAAAGYAALKRDHRTRPLASIVLEDVLDDLTDAAEPAPPTPRHITTVETRGGVL